MIIDEEGFQMLFISCWNQHHIPRLEITIKEALALLSRKIFGEHAEIGLQLEFMEIQLGGFQETILEIV